MESEYAHKIQGKFNSNGVLAKNIPLWTSAIRELANHHPFAEAPSYFYGEWQ